MDKSVVRGTMVTKDMKGMNALTSEAAKLKEIQSKSQKQRARERE